MIFATFDPDGPCLREYLGDMAWYLDILLDRREGGTEELAAPGESYYFDDTKETLRMRVERVYMRNAWAESPPSRTRHMISNVQVKSDDGSQVEVRSNFLVYRTRLEKEQDLYVGSREDLLRRVDRELKIAKRMVILDQAVLAAKNISIFF